MGSEAGSAGYPFAMICCRGEHAPEIVYSEHRLRTPLCRVGPKGTHEFEPIPSDPPGVGALAKIAPHVTMGRMLTDMFTGMENAELLVVWGANPTTDSPPLDMHRLEAAARRGCEILVIDPRRTETVVHTGARWVPIRPGTDGALALGMIAIMIEEDLLSAPRSWQTSLACPPRRCATSPAGSPVPTVRRR